MIKFGQLNEGDVVEYEGRVVRVKVEEDGMINPSFRVMSDDGIYKPQFVFDKFIKDIELSEEILETNGFKRGEHISDEEPYDLDEEGNAYYHLGDRYGMDEPHLWGWYHNQLLK